MMRWLWRGIKLVVKICIVIKLLLLLRVVFRQKEAVETVEVEEGLGPVYNEDGDTFNIMNKKNVSFLLKPEASCDKSVSLLIMVSSGPLNKANRDRWRRDAQGTAGVRLVFLVSRTVSQEDQARLYEEHSSYGDIVQNSLPDGHRQLGYKILTGYVWVARNCPHVRTVAKTDDNVYLDIYSLEGLLKENTFPEDSIACGSGTPHRNMKTLRSSGPHMTGNWSTTKEELEADIMPDFCCGFMYLTTPRVGAALVQAALVLYGDTEVVQIEDSLITGVLRERLLGVSLVTLESGIMARLWLNIFSYCPWMTITKLTFSNNLVISKTSSRSNVQYVGPITSPTVWRYYVCLHLEVGMDQLEQTAPGLVPSFIWNMCKR